MRVFDAQNVHRICIQSKRIGERIGMVISATQNSIAGSNPDDKINRFAQMKQAFGDLSSAIKAGNIADAQKAYSSLQSLRPPQSSAKSEATKDPNAASFETLGKALESGNLGDAQKALSEIENNRKAHHAHHPFGNPTTSNPNLESTNGSGGTVSIGA